MNIERLTIIAEWLEAGAPEKGGVKGFNMANLGRCGTVCCIAGTADVWWGDEGPAHENRYICQNTLGLTNQQARKLFTPLGYTAGELSPEHAARCVRNLIATGEVDWSGTKTAP